MCIVYKMCYIMFLITLVTESKLLNPRGPRFRYIAINCIESVVKSEFKVNSNNLHNETYLFTMMITHNMDSPAHEIQDEILPKLHNLNKFQIEVIRSNRRDFKSVTHSHSCPETHKKFVYKSNFVLEFRSSFYLIVIDSCKTFDQKLLPLRKIGSYNPKAEFIIFYAKITRNENMVAFVFRKLLTHLILNVKMVVPFSTMNFKLYKLGTNLNGPDKCWSILNFEIIDHCSMGNLIKNSNVNDIKMKKHLNCTINAVAMPYKPFAIDKSNGIEIDILLEAGKHLNVHFNLDINEKAESWGDYINGSWTDALGFIYQNEYSVGIGNMAIDYKYYNDFEFSLEHFSEHLVWIAPVAQLVPKWRTLIIIIFSAELWAIFIVTFVVMGFIFYTISRYLEELTEFKILSTSILSAYRVFIAAPATLPITDMVRVFFGSLALLNIIISAIYTSSLIYYLKNPLREAEVATVNDIIKSNLDIGGLKYYKDMFNKSDDVVSMAIFKRYQVEAETAIHWLKSVALDRDTCSIFSRLYVQYYLTEKENNFLLDEEGLPRIYIQKQEVINYYLNLIANKGFPLLEQLNDFIGKINSAGLMIRFTSKYYEQINKFIVLSRQQQPISSLTIAHLQGAFIVLIFGHMLGFTSLVMEILYFKCNNQLKKL